MCSNSVCSLWAKDDFVHRSIRPGRRKNNWRGIITIVIMSIHIRRHFFRKCSFFIEHCRIAQLYFTYRGRFPAVAPSWNPIMIIQIYWTTCESAILHGTFVESILTHAFGVNRENIKILWKCMNGYEREKILCKKNHDPSS